MILHSSWLIQGDTDTVEYNEGMGIVVDLQLSEEWSW